MNDRPSFRQWQLLLLVMLVVAVALAWFTGPLMWAFAVIVAVFLVWTEVVIRRTS